MKGSDTFFNEPSLRQRSQLGKSNESVDVSSKKETTPFVPKAIHIAYNTNPRPSTAVDCGFSNQQPEQRSKCHIL